MPTPAVGGGAAAARTLGIVLMLLDEALPGTGEREPGAVDAEGVAADPLDVVVLAGIFAAPPVLVPVCPLTWAAAGRDSATLSSKENPNECAIATYPLRAIDDDRSNGSLDLQFRGLSSVTAAAN